MEPVNRDSESWLTADAYHHSPGSPLSLTPLFIPAASLPHVCYSPAHPNPAQHGHLAGRGNNRCIWIANEQGALAEGTSQGALDGLIDSYLEPDASIGWHCHLHSEEYYYLLSGTLTITVQQLDGQMSSITLSPGDRHWIGPGMSHSALAGCEGARFIAVMLKCPGATS